MVTFRWVGRILATIALLVLGPAALVLLPSGLAAIAVVAVAVALGALTLWPELDRAHALGILVAATLLAGIAGVVGFAAAYNLVTDNALCGRDGGSFGDAWSLPAALAYLGAGAAAFTAPRRVLWLWPLSVLLGFAVLVAWAALFLSGGTCNT
jgi:hypothetical protein